MVVGPGPATWRRDKNKRSRQHWSLQTVKNCLHGMAQHLRHGWLLASYCEDAHHLSSKTSIHSLQTCNAPAALRHVAQTGSCRPAGTQDARYKGLRGPAVHRPAQLVCTKVHLPCVGMPCGCHLASITRRSADTGPCAGLWVASNRCKRHTVCCW
jgi:hypothetical protein